MNIRYATWADGQFLRPFELIFSTPEPLRWSEANFWIFGRFWRMLRLWRCALLWPSHFVFRQHTYTYIRYRTVYKWEREVSKVLLLFPHISDTQYRWVDPKRLRTSFETPLKCKRVFVSILVVTRAINRH